MLPPVLSERNLKLLRWGSASFSSFEELHPTYGSALFLFSFPRRLCGARLRSLSVGVWQLSKGASSCSFSLSRARVVADPSRRTGA